MWDSIAHKQLGDTAHTDKIMNLNQSLLGYYIFPAGISLVLPEISETSPAEAPPWKQVSG